MSQLKLIMGLPFIENNTIGTVKIKQLYTPATVFHPEIIFNLCLCTNTLSAGF